MAEPFLGEIRTFSFGFAPTGWALCDGQIMQITQNQALYSLLGTFYGGDGRTTFALPNLQGCVPLHMGSGIPIGRRSGEATHALSTTEIPAHTHMMQGTTAVIDSPDPTGSHLGNADAIGWIYKSTTANPVTMSAGAIANAGSSQGHENMQPYLALTFAIALAGQFPPRD